MTVRMGLTRPPLNKTAIRNRPTSAAVLVNQSRDQRSTEPGATIDSKLRDLNTSHQDPSRPRSATKGAASFRPRAQEEETLEKEGAASRHDNNTDTSRWRFLEPAPTNARFQSCFGLPKHPSKPPLTKSWTAGPRHSEEFTLKLYTMRNRL